MIYHQRIYKNISTLGSEQVMYVEEEDKCYDMAEYDYTLRRIYTTNLLLYIIEVNGQMCYNCVMGCYNYLALNHWTIAHDYSKI